MHAPLLSTHFNHTQSSFLAPQTFFFHFTPSIHSICGLPRNLIPLTSDPINLFNQFTSIFSSCPNHLTTANSLITPVFLHTSFLTQSIRVTPHVLLKHLIYITDINRSVGNIWVKMSIDIIKLNLNTFMISVTHFLRTN